MTSILLPEAEAEIEAIVAEAASSNSPLAIHGGGTRDIGRPVQAARILSTQAMTGITLYEPSEMVIAARAGTKLAEIEATLKASRQRLPFEPIDWRPLLGTRGEPTLGGVTASNAAGPRRIQAGAARDHLIGIRAVTGRGETIKSGGRVMKNVTGYDLVKLMAGSWGTLGILTEVTYKVLPEAETETTLILEGLSAERAVEAMSMALGTPFEITGAAHIPGAPSQTLLRFEGFTASCAYRRDRLVAILKPFGAATAIEGDASQALWRPIADVTALGDAPGDAVWRISVKPSEGPAVGGRLETELGSSLLYDWGGGQIWASARDEGDAGAAIVRAAIAPGGHATLVRASPVTRAAVPVFEPQPAAVVAMAEKVRAEFDPAGVLNPGRMG
ncbi:2-hydroxy-acid oxidase [Kaistia algarum]|uniref:FAD-binding protein n=1 Tax=Kaistia algarum TaxID=2083279 RepID=UPI000CE90CAF|nr:FAD-binding protein [Kaistia algarum]MCX5512505.1 FAD-binding protein [Kaistia algarum]PPE81958.1 2-hydroxy-acid oxidase [Kaistia algarum]